MWKSPVLLPWWCLIHWPHHVSSWNFSIDAKQTTHSSVSSFPAHKRKRLRFERQLYKNNQKVHLIIKVGTNRRPASCTNLVYLCWKWKFSSFQARSLPGFILAHKDVLVFLICTTNPRRWLPDFNINKGNFHCFGSWLLRRQPGKRVSSWLALIVVALKWFPLIPSVAPQWRDYKFRTEEQKEKLRGQEGRRRWPHCTFIHPGFTWTPTARGRPGLCRPGLWTRSTEQARSTW